MGEDEKEEKRESMKDKTEKEIIRKAEIGGAPMSSCKQVPSHAGDTS